MSSHLSSRRGAGFCTLAICVLPIWVLGGAAQARASVLSFVEASVDGEAGVTGLDGPLSAAVSPDGAHVYVASAVADALAVFSRRPDTGELTFVEAQFDDVGGVDGLDGPVGTQSVAVSPDGASVYAAGLNDDAVAVFQRDPATGALTFIEVLRDGIDGVDGLNGVWTVTVSPDGANVYAASVTDQAVAVFDRDAATGALSFVETHVNGENDVVGLHDP